MRWMLSVLLLMCCSFGNGLLAQTTVRQFIGSATRDEILQAYTEQVGYLDEKPYRLSPLQKLEFRTRSNQLDASRQDYAVRVNPANPWEMRSNTMYFRALRESLLLKRDEALRQALVIRYTHVIRLSYLNEMMALRAEDRKLVYFMLS